MCTGRVQNPRLTGQAGDVGQGQIIGAEQDIAGHELQLRVAAIAPQSRHNLCDEPVALRSSTCSSQQM